MCGKYHVATEEENLMMREILAEIQRRRMPVRVGDIAPGADAPVLWGQEGRIGAVGMRWGAKSPNGLVINARSETAREKPMFRHSAVHRRLLLPTTGFYEWKHLVGSRRGTQYSCRATSGSLLYMAGLCLNTSEGARFVVLTREADEQIAPLHERMPLFVAPQQKEAWLLGSAEIWNEVASALPPRLLVEAMEPEQLSLF